MKQSKRFLFIIVVISLMFIPSCEQFGLNSSLIKVSLEVPQEEINPYHIDVIALNNFTLQPIMGLEKEDFTITFNESGVYPIDLIVEGGIMDEDGHYTLFPNEDNFVYCPIIDGDVRIPVGQYILKFSKEGYQDAEIEFEVTQDPELYSTTSIDVGNVNPTLKITLYNDTFKSGGAPMELSNWDINTGTTGLEPGTIMRDNDTEVTIPFTGTAAAGTITIKAKAAALNRGIDSLVLTETVENE